MSVDKTERSKLKEVIKSLQILWKMFLSLMVTASFLLIN